MLASRFLTLVSLIAAPLALASPTSTETAELDERTFGGLFGGGGLLGGGGGGGGSGGGLGLDLNLDICLTLDLNLGGLLGGLVKRTGGGFGGFQPHTGYGNWGQHHPGGTCGDLSQINNCYKVGHACDEHCVCVPPPPAVCTDQCAILKCQAKGQATNTDCSCKQQCDCQDQFNCWQQGGKLSSNCQCVVPSKRWHRRDLPTTCAAGYSSCPVPGSAGSECLNTLISMESCGGCTSLGQGTDCSAIEGVDSVSCVAGSCAVSSCQPGYEVSSTGTTCIRSDDTAEILVGALKSAEQLLHI
ncbi:hypothetical protein BD324DRAFT_606552 [Kockovaella imperatae]|uniref:Protein CPL1-like domain-containing protein n=1 Tax=Kockovaella imperatae TaxID=4999 RepID=A0A1Y1UTI2_9TREE|nr:hypothetical protein BD324DRAFT_606552 [Kockovaella imperatae]ORX40736.1 hypothetical protein BD324DRAFT_606552 [Kockovaella imperatae]